MNGNQAGGAAGAFAAFSNAIGNSNAESGAANFKAQQLTLNSQLTDLQSQSTLESGESEAALIGTQVGNVQGAQRASYAGQGVNVDNGSAASVSESTGEQGALAEETVRQNAWRKAWGLNIESSNYKSEAAMTKLEGSQESLNTLLNGGISAATDIAKVDWTKGSNTKDSGSNNN